MLMEQIHLNLIFLQNAFSGSKIHIQNVGCLAYLNFSVSLAKNKGGDFYWLTPEMRYCEISKEMLSLYFGLAVFCLCEA